MLNRLRKRCTKLGLALLAAMLVSGSSYAQSPIGEPQAARSLEALTIVTGTGRHAFRVEVMRKPRERSRGLMFRRILPKDQGMLFDFRTVRPVGMWMRNTYISLDMIFIDEKGVVANVAENTEPLSEEAIVSARPVLSVLEVIAGTAKRLGIRPGDRIEHSLFKK